MTKQKGKTKRTREDEATQHRAPATATADLGKNSRLKATHPDPPTTTIYIASATATATAVIAAETVLPLVVQSGVLVSWTGVAELQRTSLALCEACRRCIPVRVRVGAETPRAVWTRHDDGGGSSPPRGAGGGGRSGSDGGNWRSGGGGDQTGWNNGIRTSSGVVSTKAERWWQQQQQQRRRRRRRRQTGGAVSGGGGGGGGGGSSDSGSINRNGNGNGIVSIGGISPRPRRLPRLQISSLRWEAPANHLGDGSNLPSALRELTFGRDFNRTLAGLVWPTGLERLTFGSRFNRDLVVQRDEDGSAVRTTPGSGFRQNARKHTSVDDVAGGSAISVNDGGRKTKQSKKKKMKMNMVCLLPESLKELTLGKQFNRPLPKSLQSAAPGLVTLTLGRNFCHRSSVRDAVWPSGLKVLRFGEAMLKRERKVWPLFEAMRGLASSDDDDCPDQKGGGGFAWPAGLDRVEFWKEGRAVVSLVQGGKALGEDSLEWLSTSN